MKIKLTQGYVALVDACDYTRLSKYSWCVDKRPNGLCYASTSVGYPNRRRTIRMHEMVFPDAKPERDHRNCNGLDNRRSNLRPATRAQNVHNGRKMQKNGGTSSFYKGVTFQPRLTKRPWQSRIGNLHLGYFVTAEEAGAAYDRAAKEQYGQFARTNGLNITIRPNHLYRVISKTFKSKPTVVHPKARILEYVLTCGHVHVMSACKASKLGTVSHCKTCMEAA